MIFMLKNPKIFGLWLHFSSIFTCLALGDIIGEKFFEGSSIPWYIGLIASCIINWNIVAHIKKLSDPT